MLYESYKNKIERLAKIRDFIIKYRAAEKNTILKSHESMFMSQKNKNARGRQFMCFSRYCFGERPICLLQNLEK